MPHPQLLAWWSTLLLLTILPPLLLTLRYRAQYRWFAFGVLSYVAAMILKALAYLAAERLGLTTLPPFANATLTGLISALAELALLLPFILPALRRGRHVGWPNVFAFGAAVGVAEMLFTLLLGLAQIIDGTGGATLPSLPFFTDALGWGFLIERGITILGHTSSRALLYAALRYRSWNTALLAVALFTLNDGAATYPELRGWEWTPALLASMQAFFAALVAVEFTCVYLLARNDVPPRTRAQDASDHGTPPRPPAPPPDRSPRSQLA